MSKRGPEAHSVLAQARQGCWFDVAVRERDELVLLLPMEQMACTLLFVGDSALS
jgi:hypothetical protein